MDRNRIAYFFIALVLIVGGYLLRPISSDNWHNVSILAVAAGIYFLFAIIFKKAATWLLVILDLFVCCGVQVMRLLSYQWYNDFYDSAIGLFIFGGPYSTKLFTYILLGTVVGALFEIFMRQFNKIGMG